MSANNNNVISGYVHYYVDALDVIPAKIVKTYDVR